jgi:hypothetical protein
MRFKGAAMNENITLPPIKSVKTEPIYYGLGAARYITRVSFKDGRAVTLQGQIGKKEAFYQGYFQRALDAGFSPEEADRFAKTKYPIPLKKGM